MISAVLVDFYGTIAHEDDVVRRRICERVAVGQLVTDFGSKGRWTPASMPIS